MVNESTSNTIATPGGTIHHQYPENAAPCPNACSKIVPHEMLTARIGAEARGTTASSR